MIRAPAMADRYARIAQQIASDRCVVLDGAIGTELIDVTGERPETEEHLWGIPSIADHPPEERGGPRRYADAGCDVLTTDTRGLPTGVREGRPQLFKGTRPIHWMDVARQGVRLARAAAADAGREGKIAAGFSVNGS